MWCLFDVSVLPQVKSNAMDFAQSPLQLVKACPHA
jgi:hypothetical protein